MTELKRLANWFKVRVGRGNPFLRVGWGFVALIVLVYAALAALVYELVHAIDRGDRLGTRGQWAAAILIVIIGSTLYTAANPGTNLLADTAARSPDPTAPLTVASVPTTSPIAASATTFDVRSPASGTGVTAAQVVVSGVASPGATVVQDIGFAADLSTAAASDGSWSLTVTLQPGPNELVFRMGDDRSTERKITISYAEPTAEPTLEPTAEPTAEPTPEPPPEPVFATFEDGTWFVGSDIKAGTYRLREPTSCYWSRLKGFDGSLDDIIANELVNGYGVVSISKTDKGFESRGCGEWSKDLSRVTDSRTEFGDGTFIVPTDIKPGTYRNRGGDTCYWARLKGFGGTLGQIISNHLGDGSTVVTIRSTDKGFKSSGCGTWTRK